MLFLLRIADVKSKNHLRNYVSKSVSEFANFVCAIIPKPLNKLSGNFVGMILDDYGYD